VAEGLDFQEEEGKGGEVEEDEYDGFCDVEDGFKMNVVMVTFLHTYDTPRLRPHWMNRGVFTLNRSIWLEFLTRAKESMDVDAIGACTLDIQRQ
jgi:hypothetical protein